MKKLNLLFTALMLVCCVGMAKAHDFGVNGIYYNITDATNKTVEVTYRGSYYDSYKDEYIGNLVIPESVTYNGCTYSVTSIGDEAFRSRSELKSIEIPNSVTSIGDYAFRSCDGLTSITIPNSVTSIGDYAFSYCTGLTSITIPNSVTSIGEYAFQECTGFTRFTIPNSVTSIEKGTFYRCTKLKSIEIPNSVTSIGRSAFGDCYGFTRFTIPNSITSIGERSFSNCPSLTNITIPNSVTSIGERSFSNCPSLTSITSLIPAEGLYSINSNVFPDVDKTTCTLYVPYGAKETYAATAGWNEFANIVEMASESQPGDINNDGEVNVGDFAALVNLIFNSGSQAATRE